jgi:hypothetical protein
MGAAAAAVVLEKMSLLSAKREECRHWESSGVIFLALSKSLVCV